tara:strand:- start:5801 stop:6172 length:372 start_codon:yes stop_codon:yes gene_type:complete
MAKIMKGDLDSLPWHFMLRAMSDEMFKSNGAQLSDGRDHVDVEFKINGVELDFESLIESWWVNKNRYILEKAEKLVGNRIEEALLDLRDEIGLLTERAADALNEAFSEEIRKSGDDDVGSASS